MKHGLLTGCLTALLACGSATAAPGYRKTALLYEQTFSQPAALEAWKGSRPEHFVPGAGKNGDGALRFVGKDFTGADWIHCTLDRNAIGNGLIWLEATVRGKDILPAKVGYLGTKIMLTISRKSAVSHPEPPHLNGTFDWQPAMTIQDIGPDVDRIGLSIGIQGTKGEFWVDSVRIHRCEPCEGPGDLQTLRPEGRRSSADLPRGRRAGAKFRGVMSGNDLGEDAFNTLSDWNVNLLRYQMLARKRDVSTPEKYLDWIDDEIKVMDDVLKRCAEHGIRMVIDLHTGPGTIVNALNNNILGTGTRLDVLDETWRRIAAHFRGNPWIYGYDLLNEPKTDAYLPGQPHPWLTITERLIRVIRAVDPKTPVITEPNFRDFKPVDDPRVIYSPHFYSPHSFTHQGVGGRKILWAYPGFIDGQWWDKETLREALRPVITFQKTHNVPIFVGEFSAAIWNEGSDAYIRDCIELFEEYGWDWTYHAFREAGIWNVEKEARNGKLADSPDNPRKAALLKGLKRNNRPRILILGNSITRHGPAPKIGWHTNWGMAASAKEKDYVHLLLKAFTDAANGQPPAFLFENIAVFERTYKDIPDLRAYAFPFADFRADTVILAVGENVPALKTPEDETAFERALTALAHELCGDRNARLIVRSCFWPDAAKDRVLRKVCDAFNGTFVDISALAKNEENFARSERAFEHAGVANHPGDRGMKAIADAIANAAFNRN